MSKNELENGAVGQDVASKSSQADRPSDEERREVMKKLGKYAAFTAPAMLVLYMPRKHTEISHH
jgi:hypothetical protein